LVNCCSKSIKFFKSVYAHLVMNLKYATAMKEKQGKWALLRF
jgi:hypothetical protein